MMVRVQPCLPPRVGGIFPCGGGESCREGPALPGKVTTGGRCPKTCFFLSCSSLLPCPCSEELQKEGLGLVSLGPLQHIPNVLGLSHLQEGTFLPKTGALLFWVVLHGIPGNRTDLPAITQEQEWEGVSDNPQPFFTQVSPCFLGWERGNQPRWGV